MKETFSKALQAIRSAIKTCLAFLGRFPKVVRLLAYTGAAFVLCVVSFVTAIWVGVFGGIPTGKDLGNINSQVATEVYSADSVLLGRYYLQERSTVPANEIPDALKNALIGTEDVRFYDHEGIDTRSLLRVFFKSILMQDESAGGGSTLTQQLAKNLYPRRSYAFFSLAINKIKEMIIAKRLEKAYSKDEILVLYLNTIPFGDNVFGAKTAAERFFSIPVKQLTVDQSAVLIGMLKATHRYNPRIYPERSKQRRDVVLAQMEKYKFITAAECKTYQEKPLILKYHRLSQNEGLAPYFRSYIKTELMLWCREHQKPDGSPYNIYTDGLKIYTTIDSRLQSFAEDALKTQMSILQEKFVNQLSQKTLDQITKSRITQLSQYKLLKSSGMSEKNIMTELRKKSLKRVFDWKGEKEIEMSSYDSLSAHIRFLQAGLLAMDPASGALRAWVGGIDHEFFQYDHVKETTKRQVGSTFKPIVYAAAMEQGISPCDYVSARKTSYTNMEDWTPENSENDTYDHKYSMEGGLAGSVNTVSVKMLEKAGISNTIRTAARMGIKSELPAVPSLALGTASVSVVEMVNAYSVFANKGKFIPPIYITGITNTEGKVLELFKQEGTPLPALSSETSAMMVHMLKRVVNEGTGAGLRSRYGLKNDIAGKTGTTQSNADGWFIAITPKLVVGCWVGADDPRLRFKSTALGQGAATALPIVGKFFQELNKDQEFSDISNAVFGALSPALMEKLDCELSKSDRNFLERLFNRKKKVKQSEFKETKKIRKERRIKKRRGL
ncbi:MAG: transglycosylase domain-containing protein [Chryseolinea sp.]